MSGPDVWGPHGWKFIHFVALGYPSNPSSKNKEDYYDFFHTLQNVIPCSICGNHYKELLKKNPITDAILSSRQKLIEWTILIHNKVNESIKKKVYTIDEAMKEINKNIITECDIVTPPESKPGIEKFTNNNDNQKYIYISIIIVLLIIIMIIVYKNYI